MKRITYFYSSGKGEESQKIFPFLRWQVNICYKMACTLNKLQMSFLDIIPKCILVGTISGKSH